MTDFNVVPWGDHPTRPTIVTQNIYYGPVNVTQQIFLISQPGIANQSNEVPRTAFSRLTATSPSTFPFHPLGGLHATIASPTAILPPPPVTFSDTVVVPPPPLELPRPHEIVASSSSSVSPSTGPWGMLKRVHDTFTDIPEEFLLNDNEITIGRLAENTARIYSKEQSKFVSRHHAKIRKTLHGYEIDDLNSLNGTFVNGKKIKTNEPLKHGDLVMITGGSIISIDGYITIPNGPKRSEVISEEDWKMKLIEHMKQSFMYRFETLNRKDQSIVIEASTPKRKISEVEEHESSSPKKQKDIQAPSDGNQMKKLFNDHLTCNVCLGWFVEPRTLQCGHTLCKKCLYDCIRKPVRDTSNPSCPTCRCQLTQRSVHNRNLENIIEHAVKFLSGEEQEEIRERTKRFQKEMDQELAELHRITKRAQANQFKFLNINNAWVLIERKTWFDSVKIYFGSCRQAYCSIIGFTAEFIKTCDNQTMQRACENLGISVPFMYVTNDKVIRKEIDFVKCRAKLLEYYNADDNLFFQ